MAVAVGILAALGLAVVAAKINSPAQLLSGGEAVTTDNHGAAVQLENVYLPGTYGQRSNVLSKASVAPRIPQGGERVSQALIADTFAQATSGAINLLRKDAFKPSTNGLINTVSTDLRPPLMLGVNGAYLGDLRNYPFAAFDADVPMTSLPNYSDPTIFGKQNPFPEQFTGPKNDILSLGTAPDSLRNPWNAGGAWSRLLREAREPMLDSRPPNPLMPKPRGVVMQNDNLPWRRNEFTR